MRAVEALLVYAVAMKVIQVEEVTQKQQDIRKLWKDVLLNQFHDVLRKLTA
jgi:alpha-mannosidase